MHSYYSQKGTIIRALQDCGPQKVSFFMKGRYFVGDRASARIHELIQKGNSAPIVELLTKI